eukprot:scpid83716/ scgid29457/ 
MAEGGIPPIGIPLEDYSKLIDRHALVLGRSGSGKTTIINMLINNGYLPDDCNGPNKIGHGAAAGTASAKFSIALESKLLLCDTIGFGDRMRAEHEILKNLQNIYNSAKIGINCIIVVAKCQRWCQEDILLIDIIDRLFESKWPQQAILVLTHYEGSLDGKEKALKDWCSGDAQATAILQRFKHVVATNNSTSPLLAAACEDYRKSCLEKLVSSIQSFKSQIVRKPVKFADLFLYLIRKLQDIAGVLPNTTAATLKHAKSLVLGGSGESYEFCSCGICGVCSKDIPIEQVASAACGHQFHLICALAHESLSGSRGSVLGTRLLKCPLCFQPIERLYTNFRK